MYGSARRSYVQMLDPIHNQGVRLCVIAFRISTVNTLYVDAHGPCLDARHAKLPLQYATKIKGRKEMFYLTTHSTNCLRLYGVRHMVKDHSNNERGNPLAPHELLFPISSKGSFICIIPQTG